MACAVSRVVVHAMPAASANGPLHGERVVVIASPHSALPTEIAAAGGRVMANVGRTTTLLVVAGTRAVPDN